LRNDRGISPRIDVISSQDGMLYYYAMIAEHPGSHSKELSRNQTEVLSCLRAAAEPLSAYTILDRVRPSGIAHPPTIYRALNELMQLGMVHRLQSRPAYVACDHGGCNGKFAFATCRHCQKVFEIPLSNADHAALVALSPKDISVEYVTLELSGLCRRCRSTTRSSLKASGIRA
jgi:Fur family transcriptional regulator, zinc uptake regulator